jgi:CHAT domain-containing protein/tetratricopeptide (TPR) repeat protein
MTDAPPTVAADLHLERFGLTGDESCLLAAISESGFPGSSFSFGELSISLLDAALARHPAPGPRRTALLRGASLLRCSVAVSTQDVEQLRAAVAVTAELVARMDQADPARAGFLAPLGRVRMDLARATGDQGGLAEALRVFDDALVALPANHPTRPDVLADAARLGIELAANTDAPALGEVAVERYRELARREPARARQAAADLEHVGDVLDANADVDAVDLRLAVWCAAADLAPDASGPLERLFSAAVEFRRRFVAGGSREDARHAIERFHAVAERSAGPLRHRAIVGAGDCLLRLHERSEDPTDYDASVEHWRAALAATPAADEASADYLGGLAGTLVQRAQALGDPRSLDAALDAVDATWAALEGQPISDAHRRRLEEIEHTVADNRFFVLRRGEDLERALGLASRAFAAAAPEERTEWATKYAEHLIHAFERSGRQGALNDAIAVLEQAPPEANTVPPVRARWLELAGNSYLNRHHHWGASNLQDVARAQDCFQQALEITPPGNPKRIPHMLGLAEALERIYRITFVPQQTRELPIELLEQAVGEVQDERQRAFARLNLGTALAARASSARRRPDDRKRAIDLLEQALAGADADPSLLDADVPLADSYAAEFAQTGDASARDRASALYRSAVARLQDRSVDLALATASRWGAWAADRGAWPEAAEAFEQALPAAASLYRANVAGGGARSLLRVSRLPAEAAYALTLADRPREAALALEQSRFRAGSEAAALVRADLATLRRTRHGELVDRLLGAADAWRSIAGARDEAPAGATSFSMRISFESLEQVTAGAALPPGRAGTLQPAADLAAWEAKSHRARAARHEFDAIADEIRALPGFGGFLTEATATDVRCPVPLVYLAAGKHGGVAVAVRPGEEPVAERLGSLTHEAVAEEVRRFREAYADAARWRSRLEATTRRLWTAAMKTVVELAAGADRVVVVPSGILGVLPLHAAWRPDDAAVTGRRYASDDIVIAYAPNARSLDLEATFDGDELVAVADPEPLPTGVPALSFAGPEIAAAMTCFGHAELIAGARADRRTVLDSLRGGTVHHLACHGRLDLERPRRSALILAGGAPLTFDDLLELRLRRRPEGRLALLTACDTAIAGGELPDEVVSLPAALLQVGFSAVVASQWAVAGLPTAFLAARFYGLWKDEGLAPAKALACAQAWVRDSTDDQKTAFVEESRLPAPARRSLWRAVAGGGDRRRFKDIADWAAYTYVGNPGKDRDDA